ncbi:cytotoxic T-lymphocyte protein 4 [Cottoperca gobio]|uniref:Cytotoxic T-lymphocyte protein 4 n=1 Tax=Cottoperca gobio TaxID=56716 RepID=A0A6J2RWI4_COTGO|nr:cytotoxic T-lymphocyte protein 4-like [Cottoperca gobio]
MFLTRCVMLWILLTVLSLPVWSDVKVIQQYKVVSADGTAKVQCFIQPSYHQTPHYPYPEPEELRVTLLKGLHGTQKLCSSILNFTEQREAGVEKEGEVQCSAEAREGALEVTVSGLKAADTDLYRCEVQIFYPPPYLRLTGNGTLIHVLGSSDCPVLGAQRQISNPGDEGEDEEGEERTAAVSVPVVVLVVLVIFVLIIIIYFQTLQCERGRRDVRAVPSVLHKADAAALSCSNFA